MPERRYFVPIQHCYYIVAVAPSLSASETVMSTVMTNSTSVVENKFRFDECGNDRVCMCRESVPHTKMTCERIGWSSDKNS